jgi:hypothetical protein
MGKVDPEPQSSMSGPARRPPTPPAAPRRAGLPRVRDDFMSGVRSGVNGTPTFYINGLRHDDSYELETMLAAIARAGDS